MQVSFSVLLEPISCLQAVEKYFFMRTWFTGGRSRNGPGFNFSAFLDHVWVTQEEVKAHSLSHRRNVFPCSQGKVWVLWVCWCLPLGQTQPRREIPVWADLTSSACSSFKLSEVWTLVKNFSSFSPTIFGHSKNVRREVDFRVCSKNYRHFDNFRDVSIL